MSVAMAMAFPSRGAQPVPVGIAAGPRRRPSGRRCAKAAGIIVRDVPPGGEQRALREGIVHLIVVPADPPTYRFDPARAESRTARLVVDDVLKRAAGRTDPWQAREEPVEVPGSRYIDWLIPGIVAMGIMSNGMWGIGFSIVQARMRKLLKRHGRQPDAQERVPAGAAAGPADLSGAGSGRAAGLRRAGVRHAGQRQRRGDRGRDPDRRAGVRRARLC